MRLGEKKKILLREKIAKDTSYSCAFLSIHNSYLETGVPTNRKPQKCGNISTLIHYFSERNRKQIFINLLIILHTLQGRKNTSTQKGYMWI